MSSGPPLHVLIKPGRQKTKGDSHIAVLSGTEGASSEILHFHGLEASFLPSAQLDLKGYRGSARCYGCIGVLPLKGEPFVGFVTGAQLVGTLESAKVMKITSVKFFSLLSPEIDYEFEGTDPSTGSPSTHPCVQIAKFYSSGSFFFSREWDLTLSLQKRAEMGENQGVFSFWDHIDNRFFWNKYPLKDLIRLQQLKPGFVDQSRLLIPLIQGYVDFRNVTFPGGKAARIALISRLSCERAGTRFNARGVDDDGNVANFVETEQIVYHEEFVLSYVQVRGSVPLFWEQRGLQIGSSPKLELSRGSLATEPAFRRHFDHMIATYGTQHIVNLLSPKTNEDALSSTYQQQTKNLNSHHVESTNFDFNVMCKGHAYENLGVLLSELEDNLQNFQFFLSNAVSKEVILRQRGVFRTNCVDCLDRTNVVQGAIAQYALDQQLNVVSWGFTGKQAFSACLSEMWANNADALSMLYAGTAALRSEYTRLGKRTFGGRVDDVLKNVNRFVVNNFQDDSKQAIIELVLGKFQMKQQRNSLIRNPVLLSLDHEIQQSTEECKAKKTILVHVGTWNVNTRKPHGESLLPWLTFENMELPDIYVLGFQELVELSAKQVISTDEGEREVWGSLLLRILNRKEENLYVLLRAEQLVGVCLFVFVRREHVPHITNVDACIEKTGLSGMSGNKGGVGIRFDLHSSSFCFVTAHLAAGHKNYEERNRDYNTIATGMKFYRGWRIEDHDQAFWLGDFNYRVDLSNEEVRRRVQAKDYATLLRYDQLDLARKNGKAFPFFTEGHITFAPTYKYDLGSNTYDTSEKMRIPAWTDRILWLGERVAQIFYDRAEIFSSDHRPVKALFHCDISVIDQPLLDQIVAELYRKNSKKIAISESRAAASSNSHTPSPRPPATPQPAHTPSPAPAVPKVSPPAAAIGTLIDFGPDIVAQEAPATTAKSAFSFPDSEWASALQPSVGFPEPPQSFQADFSALNSAFHPHPAPPTAVLPEPMLPQNARPKPGTVADPFSTLDSLHPAFGVPLHDQNRPAESTFGNPNHHQQQQQQQPPQPPKGSPWAVSSDWTL